MDKNQQNQQNQQNLIQKFINKAFIMLNNDESKKYIQIYLIDPLLNHILERIFPYIILTTVLFIILILCIVAIFIFIYFHIKQNSLYA